MPNIALRILKNGIQARQETTYCVREDQYRSWKGKVEGMQLEHTVSCSMDRNLRMLCGLRKGFWRSRLEKINAGTKKTIGVEWKDQRLTGSLYMRQIGPVKIKNRSRIFETSNNRKNWQGCQLSQILFNIYFEDLIREAMDGMTEGVKEEEDYWRH